MANAHISHPVIDRPPDVHPHVRVADAATGLTAEVVSHRIIDWVVSVRMTAGNNVPFDPFVIADISKTRCVQLCCHLDNLAGAEVSATAVNARTLLRLARIFEPDFIVLTVDFLRLYGVRAVRAVQDENPCVEMLVLPGWDGNHVIVSKLEVGETGYALTDLQAGEFPQAIHFASRDKARAWPEGDSETLARAV